MNAGVRMKERATLSWLWEVSGKTKFNVAFLIFLKRCMEQQA